MFYVFNLKYHHVEKVLNVSIYFGGGSKYSDGQIYAAARSGIMYIYVQSDWHTSVRCSQQYHQPSSSVQSIQFYIGASAYMSTGTRYTSDYCGIFYWHIVYEGLGTTVRCSTHI